MKKITAFLLCALILIGLSACSETAKDNSGEKDEQNDVKLSLVASDTKVSAGEEVSVVLNFSGGVNIACFDVFVEAAEGLEYVKRKTNTPENFTLEVSNLSEENKCKVSGYTMYTYDFPNNDICEITYKIPDNAKSGDKYAVTLSILDFQAGTDKDGAECISIADKIIMNNIEFTVE